MDLAQTINSRLDQGGSKPEIFDLSKPEDQAKVSALIESGKIQITVDDFEEQQLELFGVNNPSKVYAPGYKEEFKAFYTDLQKQKPLHEHGKWVYYSWLSKFVHVLPEQDFYKVRTNRNRNLINVEEQDKFYNATIGIGGLSVGSNIAYSFALQGGGNKIKIADMDRLALSNTNRILTGVENLGILKVDVAARFMYQINPYFQIETHAEGLHDDNIDDFMKDLDIMIDEIDTFPVKYRIREKCKEYGIPLIMAADNGDNAVVDVERYDLDKNTPFFHGRIGDMTYDELTKLDKFGIGKTITKHVGPENVTERMQASLLEMGKTIVSWPQLGGAALLNGAAVAYVARKILNGQSVEGNRALINMDSMLDPAYNSPEAIKRRDEITAGFRKMFGL